MTSLSPPIPLARHRANSTGTCFLGRRPSTQTLQIPATPPLVLQEKESASMLYLFASRLLHWTVPSMQAWSHPSTPNSTPDDFVLPLSVPAQLSLDQVLLESPSEKRPISRLRLHLSSTHIPILIVILLLPISTILVILSLHTLPISVSWPKNITDLAQLGRELHGYSQSGPMPMAHVVGVMAITAIWKHAWSIPGSVIWNVLAGALFSPAFATVLMAVLTTIGSACASLLSKPMAPFLAQVFPRALEMTRHALEGDSSNSKLEVSTADLQESTPAESSPWVRLSILRLIGVVPWSGINIACGVCGVAITDCMLGAFIGTLPWTAVTCQIGDILQTVASSPSPTPKTVSSLLASPEIILKLAFLSFLSLAPILGRDRLRGWISHKSNSSQTTDGTSSRLTTLWRTTIRRGVAPQTDIPSQQQDQLTLQTLIEEKTRGAEEFLSS